MNILNTLTGSPIEPYTKSPEGKFKANLGNYHIDSAYGGNKLVRMCSIGGGITSISSGYVSRRELYDIIHAMINFLYDNQKEKAQ